jgi:ZIP family zinc transporter
VNIIAVATLASAAAGAMTAVGAIPVLFGGTVSLRAQDTLLGFAAGVMLAASFFSLIIPAIDVSRQLSDGALVPALIAAGGVMIGVAAIAIANELIPHRHFVQGHEGPRLGVSRKVWLFVAAITIHNFPEGGAVGVGYAGDDFANATALAVGIGLQNAPEGLAVAVALLAEGYSRGQAFVVASLTALVEPIGGFVGIASVTLMRPLLPWALTFAAGAMIYVVSHEIIPETHTRGYQREATAGLSIGLVLMMFLDVALGQ